MCLFTSSSPTSPSGTPNFATTSGTRSLTGRGCPSTLSIASPGFSAAKFAKDQEETFELAAKVLSLAVRFYLPFDEQERELFPRLFMREVQRKRRSKEAGGRG